MLAYSLMCLPFCFQVVIAALRKKTGMWISQFIPCPTSTALGTTDTSINNPVPDLKESRDLNVDYYDTVY